MHIQYFGRGQCAFKVLLVCLTVVVIPAAAAAATVTRPILKTYFETGDVPTAQQFATLIDSYVHQTDDGFTLVGVGTEGGTTNALRIGGNVGINELIPFTTLHPSMAPLWTGQSGFLPLKYMDSSAEAHYGFLQIHMDASSLLPPAINVDYWAWETSPNTTLTTFTVTPEPGSLTIAAMSSMALLARRQRRRR